MKYFEYKKCRRLMEIKNIPYSKDDFYFFYKIEWPEYALKIALIELREVIYQEIIKIKLFRWLLK